MVQTLVASILMCSNLVAQQPSLPTDGSEALEAIIAPPGVEFLPLELLEFRTLPYACVDVAVERAVDYAAASRPKRAASKIALATEIPEYARDYLRAHYLLASGNRRKGRRLLGAIAKRDSPLAHRAAFLLADYPQQRGKNEEAAELLGIASKHPGLRGKAGIRLAELLEKEGKSGEAAEVLRGAVGSLATVQERAEAMLRVASVGDVMAPGCRSALIEQAFVWDSGDLPGAERHLKKKWGAEYQDIELLRLLLSGSRWEWRRELASALTKQNRAYEQAMLEGIIAKKRRKAAREPAPGHFERAFRLAGSGLREAMALYFKSRSLEALDRDLEARDIYDRIRHLYPDFPLARRVSYRMSAIAAREGLPLQAMALLEEYLSTACPAEDMSDGLWLAGFVSYLAGDYGRATEHWRVLVEDFFFHPNHKWVPYGPMALYWSSLALEQHGSLELARQQLDTLATEFQGNYYGLRAAVRGGTSDKPFAPRPGRLEVSPLTVPAVVRLPEVYAGAVALFRLGLWDEAFDELRSLIGQGLVAQGAVRLMLSAYLRTNKLADSLSFRRQYGVLSPPWDGGSRLWRLSLPLSFTEAIEAGYKSSSMHRALTAAIIRFESNFNPRVVSTAKAIGLLQVKRTTASHVAVPCLHQKRVKAKELMEPVRNVVLGSFYITELFKRHHDNTAVGLAAYNAGPGTARWWLARFCGLNTDEFVEQITYPNTAAYVKRILGVVPIYWSLHFPVLGSSVPPLPMGGSIPDDLQPFLDERGGTCYKIDADN